MVYCIIITFEDFFLAEIISFFSSKFSPKLTLSQILKPFLSASDETARLAKLLQRLDRFRIAELLCVALPTIILDELLTSMVIWKNVDALFCVSFVAP